MQSLDVALQEKKLEFKEFGELTRKVLHYLPNVLSHYEEKNDYRIYHSKIAGTTKFVRPINTKLFCFNPTDFDRDLIHLNTILAKIKKRDPNISKHYCPVKLG